MAELVAVGFDPFSKSKTPDDFSARYGAAAEKAAKALGVSPSIVLGQWGLETGWGKSVIPGTNNLGNIKDFAGGGVAATDNMNGSRDKYRAYDSPDQFVDDYVSLIQRKYPNAVNAKTPEEFAKALKSGGYAEDPGYVAKVTTAARMTPVKAASGPTLEPVDFDPFAAPEVPADVPRIEVRGTSADAEPLTRTQKVMQGVVDPINGGAQLLTRMLPSGVVNAGNQLNNYLADKTGLVARLPEGGVDEQVRAQEAEYAARRAAAGESGMDGYRLIGNVVSPVNLAVGAGAAGAALPSLGRAAAMGAGAGGMSAALNPIATGNPEDFAAEKIKQIGIGAAAGGVMAPIAAGIGRLVSPNASTNAQNKLLQEAGVRQTIGQTLGGTANNVEQRLTSVPILGDAISGARRTAQDDLRRAVQNRVTDPIRGATRVAETGTEGVAAVANQVDDAYNAARNAMGAFRIDQQGAQELGSVRQMINSLAPKEQRQFQSVWSELQQDMRNGVIDAATFKRVDSKLGQEAARFRGAVDPYQRQLGDSFAELQRVIQEAGRRANPKAGALFDQADEAFANLVRLQDAAKRAAAQEGQFTPGQLTQAVRAADRSARKNATARGEALMQDLSSAGNRLSNTVPDSGTAGRTFTGLAALASGTINPLIPAGIAASSGLYTQPAQSLLRLLATARPHGAQAARNALLQASPSLGPLAAQVALQGSK